MKDEKRDPNQGAGHFKEQNENFQLDPDNYVYLFVLSETPLKNWRKKKKRERETLKKKIRKSPMTCSVQT